MKKRMGLLVCLLFTAAFLGGCGGKYTTLAELNTDKYVTLGEYKGLEISVPVMEVTDDYIDNYIGFILSSQSQWEVVSEDRPAKMGDMVNIDYVGKIDGEAFAGGTDQGYDLQLGSGAFIPGFEEGLVGAVKGETRDVTLTFPDPYLNNPDMSGAEAVFTVTINEMKEKRMPELTDDFVVSLGLEECSTVEEYREYVRTLGEQYALETYDKNVEESLIGQAMAGCTFQEPPKAMVDEYYDTIVKNFSLTAASGGLSLEQLFTSYGITMEQFEEEERVRAAEECRRDIMLQAIANKENITVSQEEIDAADVDSTGSGNGRDAVMRSKVVAFLRENAAITE